MPKIEKLSNIRGAALTASVAEAIRKNYLSTNSTSPAFLPSERDLAIENKVARTTARWALQQLADEGLLRAEHGRGYRILPRTEGQKIGSRLAVVTPPRNNWLPGEGGISDELGIAFQRRAIEQKYQVLFIGSDQASDKGFAKPLVDDGVWGAVLTQDDQATFNALDQAGIPCVMLDCAWGKLPIDYIVQDNFNGARSAAEKLLSVGCRRIAWFGPVRETRTSIERFSGASSTFLQAGVELQADLICNPQNRDLDEAALALLSRPDRPDAVMALWVNYALAVGRAAERLGLRIGKDLHLAAWATERAYEEKMVPAFQRHEIASIVTWSTDAMAKVCMTRLSSRLREPDAIPLRLLVPTQLRCTGQQERA